MMLPAIGAAGIRLRRDARKAAGGLDPSQPEPDAHIPACASSDAGYPLKAQRARRRTSL